VQPWLDLMDNIRELGVARDLEGGIPQIAVMGDQSSGKSSVLEALSGVQFPRGTGCVTRCATEVRMRCCTDNSETFNVSLSWSKQQPEEAGACSREEIGSKITRLTEHLLASRGAPGRPAAFEKEHAIVVEMQARDVPDLTIIDLPGIIRTVVDGQEDSVIQDVRSLISRYLDQQRTVILAVCRRIKRRLGERKCDSKWTFRGRLPRNGGRESSVLTTYGSEFTQSDDLSRPALRHGGSNSL